MIKRIVDISNPAFIHLETGQMIVEQEGKTVAIPIEDLGILIIDSPQATISRAVLAACAANETVVLISDDKHLPASILLPLSGHALQTKIIAVQVNAMLPVKKRLWQQIIRQKIRGQAQVLKSIHGAADPLLQLVQQVLSGDTSNIEGRAAQLYWQRLFGAAFRRNPDLEGRNALLNYGYAVIRAAVARSIVGSGLHPSLGIHHHNQYDTFSLADDLMEVLRPLVDLRVALMTDGIEDEIEICKETKAELLDLLHYPVHISRRPLPLMVALHSYTASFARALEGKGELEIPLWSGA